MTMLPVHIIAGLIAIVAGFAAVFASRAQSCTGKAG